MVAAGCGSSAGPSGLIDSGGGTADARGGGPDAAPDAITPTAHGTPIGAPATGTIDPATGLELTSADGSLTLRVPGGAVATATAITITPITGEASLALPTAWRIDPAGIVLAAPAQMQIQLATDDAHRDDTDSLFVVEQDAQGYWNAGAAASWDDATRTATAAAPTTLGDVALTSCVALVSDSELALSAPAHLRVLRQCEAPPASGQVGGAVATTDPVAWTDAAEAGGSALGTLASSGATATLAPPAQPPQSGIPVTVVTASVSVSLASGERPFALHTLVLDNHVAIASFAQWTLEGTTYSAVLGSSVISQGGNSNLSLSDPVHSASLSIAFPGDHPGGFAATTASSEVSASGNDLRYTDHYSLPCDSTTIETLETDVSVTTANDQAHQMFGVFDGTLAIARGTVQCSDGPQTDIVEVPLTGTFRLIWDQL